jgi:hypothetical protein
VNKLATLAEHTTAGNSVRLAKIDDKIFTIMSIEDSDYTQGEVTKGVKITRKKHLRLTGIFSINSIPREWQL